MRLKYTKSKNSEHYCIIQDITINGKRTTKVFENIGNFKSLCELAGDCDPIEWVNNYIDKLNAKDKESKLPVIITKHCDKLIDKDKQIFFNAGYLFLQDIYYKLGLNSICSEISTKHQFQYNLNDVFSNLLFSRILDPCSKRKTQLHSNHFLSAPKYELQHSYRSLEVIAQESEFIQAQLYKNSLKYMKRDTSVLYYDCTNFFFEIEESNGLKQYGKSKENRPNPIVQMGLFLDVDGIPLAFDITSGNTNEQITLRPLEKRIINDFKHSKFIVCTDAGLASTANRKFNNTNNRRFITTQPLKKLKGYLKEESLDLTKGWKLIGSDNTYDISKLRSSEELIKKYKNVIFYKERSINENDIEQRLIVSYSVKYQEYKKHIRSKHIERALKLIESAPSKIGKGKQNDPKRFIEKIEHTENGELAEKTTYFLNEELITEEARYDGLYAVCTNLEDDVEDIIKINKNRWEIEESFRIMKSEFKAIPVYLSRDDRIKAHFTTCFISLILYKYLEKELNNEFTVIEIIDTLKEMNLTQDKNNYFPSYTRSDLTDRLHETFGFRIDYEVSTYQQIKKIINKTKKQKTLRSFLCLQKAS